MSERSPIDRWRDTYQRVWFRLEEDGRSARHVIAGWADCKPSTAGAWKRGDCTPSGGTMNVLARNAAADGYPALAQLTIPDNCRLVDSGDNLRVNGCLDDEKRDITRILHDIQQADHQGDAEWLHRLADELHHEADEVSGEANLKT